MKKKAIVLGINKATLKCAKSDAHKIKEVLEESNFDIFDMDISQKEVTEYRNIFGTYFEDLKENDVALFYFAGHSFIRKGASRLCLAIDNSKIADESTCLPIEDLITSIETCQAENKIIILDSCESGAIINNINTGQRNTNYFVLCATEIGKQVREFKNKNLGLDGGLLSHLIYQAFKKIDTGAINSLSLLQYIKEEEDKYNREFKIKSNIVSIRTRKPIVLKEPFFNLSGMISDTEIIEQIPETCLDFLKFLKDLDDKYPLVELETNGRNDAEHWLHFLDKVNKDYIDFLSTLSLPLLEKIREDFESIEFQIKEDLVIYFRKFIEVDALLYIYKTLRTEFNYNLPEDKNFFAQLWAVDQFGYSKDFLDFDSSAWMKLVERHQEKKESLNLILNKLLFISRNDIDEQSENALKHLKVNIDEIIDFVNQGKKNLKSHQNLAIFYSSQNYISMKDCMLDLFESIVSNINISQSNFNQSFRDKALNIKEYPKPVITKHKIIIRENVLLN